MFFRWTNSRDHFVYAPSQWEATLLCNVVSHWLGANTKWSLEQSRLEAMTHTWRHRYDSAHTVLAMRKGFSWTFIVMMIFNIAYLRIVDLGSMPVITGSGRYEKVKPVVMLRSPMLTVMTESRSSVVRSGVRHRITVSLLENRKERPSLPIDYELLAVNAGWIRFANSC